MAASPGLREWRLVRLLDVPEHIRVAAAEQLVLDEGLVGPEALLLRLVAYAPRQNPALRVTAAKARRVLGY